MRLTQEYRTDLDGRGFVLALHYDVATRSPMYVEVRPANPDETGLPRLDRSRKARAIFDLVRRWCPGLARISAPWTIEAVPVGDHGVRTSRRPLAYSEAVRVRPTLPRMLAPFLALTEPSAPLYPYQKVGVEWLLAHPRAVLADDMGLGKTVQVISGARRLIWSGDITWCLVVCPSSLQSTWEREFARWAPELEICRRTPPAAAAADVWRALLYSVHVIVTSYSHLRAAGPTVVGEAVPLLILDEAHKIRKPSSGATRALRKLVTTRTWAITGTPIENEVADLATILSVIDPDKQSATGPQSEMYVRARARPYLLRRRKADVLADLPKASEHRVACPLTQQQIDSYDVVVRGLLSSNSGDVLAAFTNLRRICDFDESTGASSKIDRAQVLLKQISDRGEKAVVFSYILAPLHLLAERLSGGTMAAVLYTGEADVSERDVALDRFLGGAGPAVLLASSRIASEGLTLTVASHVIFLNEWWNPSANDQARDRVLRIGQERPVHVYRLYAPDTVEDRLAAILESKETTFEVVVESLSVDALRELA